jgi:rhomboid family protein
MEPQRIFGMTPWVRRLFAANLLVFVLQETVLGVRFQNAFGFAPLDAFAHPWTFVTYLFVHANLLHLAFNLLGLFVFGPKVEERLGQKTFLLYYVACGIGGAVLSLALTQVVQVGLVVGASGAVLGVALAYAWYYPDAEIFVFPLPTPIPARWLVVLAVAVNLALAFWPGASGVAYLAHLGGMATGFLWLKTRGWREERGGAARPAPAAAPGVLVHPGPRVGRASASPSRARRPTADGTDRTQAEMDRVLEKISAHGLGSLTPAERKFLADMSRKMRDRD